MARRVSLALLLLAVLATLCWLRGRGDPHARLPGPMAAEPDTLPATAVEVPPARSLATAESIEVVPERPPEHSGAGGAAPTTLQERPDLEARDWLEIQVLDPEGRPVFDAELEIRGLRKRGDSGSWYGMRGGPTTARSDPDGRARLAYVRWVDLDGRTVRVDLRVAHPEFVPFRDSSFPMGPGQHAVVLQRGATVVVSAWTGSPDHALGEFTIQADRKAQLPPQAWVREKDGRLSTTRLAPGMHYLWLRHKSPEHGELASAIERFELAENEWKELHLELRPCLTREGRLDDSVPRPVEDGRVRVNLHEGDQNSIARDFEAAVQEDGTFELTGLPPARGQIIALCRGWVSRRTRVETPEEAGIHFSYDPSLEQIRQALERAGDSAFQAQRMRVPDSEPLVVLMEPSGAVNVVVRQPDGSPLPGAQVSATPHVYLIGVGSAIFPGRDWSATTDAGGRAWIEDLPPDESMWVAAGHASFRMSRKQRKDTPSVRIVSGQTAELVLVLEPKDE